MKVAVLSGTLYRTEQFSLQSQAAPMSNLATTPAILLVEDEPLVRIVHGEVLSEAGLKVLEAANAEEALTVLAASIDVRVLVTDVEMPPGASGFDLAHEVARRWPPSRC